MSDEDNKILDEPLEPLKVVVNEIVKRKKGRPRKEVSDKQVIEKVTEEKKKKRKKKERMYRRG